MSGQDMTEAGEDGTVSGMSEDRTPAHHDLGGAPRFMCEPIDRAPHELSAFDREVDAIRGLLAARQLMAVDELRRGIEAIPDAAYHRLTYYQRWLRSMVGHLLAKGVVTEAELAAAMRDVS